MKLDNILTVFNRTTDENGKDILIKHHVKGFIQTKKGSRIRGTTISTQDSLMAFIEWGIPYVNPKNYNLLSSQEQANSVTFQPQDKIVRGKVEKDYTRITDIEKEHETFTIDSHEVFDYDVLNHYEVYGT